LEKLQVRFPLINVSAVNLYHRKSLEKFWKRDLKYDLLFCNPPQEGVKFIRRWVESSQVKHVLYVSCSVESFMSDVQQLMKAKFQLENIELVDQFPHTPHIEILSHWSKIS